MSKVTVTYSGKRCPLTIGMPWLAQKPVTFDNSREAVMVKQDAERLCAENPTVFKIVGEIIEDMPTPEPEKPKLKTKKKAPAKKPQPTKE